MSRSDPLKRSSASGRPETPDRLTPPPCGCASLPLSVRRFLGPSGRHLTPWRGCGRAVKALGRSRHGSWALLPPWHSSQPWPRENRTGRRAEESGEGNGQLFETSWLVSPTRLPGTVPYDCTRPAIDASLNSYPYRSPYPMVASSLKSARLLESLSMEELRTAGGLWGVGSSFE